MSPSVSWQYAHHVASLSLSLSKPWWKIVIMFIFFLFFFTGVSASSSALLSAHKSCASEKDLNKLNGILSLSLAQVSVIYIYVFVLSSTIFQQIDYYRKLNIGLAALFYLTTSHTLCFLPDWFFLVVFLHPHFFHFNFLLLRFVHAIASQPASNGNL